MIAKPAGKILDDLRSTVVEVCQGTKDLDAVNAGSGNLREDVVRERLIDIQIG